MRCLMVVGLMLAAMTVVFGEPVQANVGWAIYEQKSDADWDTITQGENLALGKTVTYQPEPNYAATRDEGDAVQLTDGELADAGGRGYVNKRSVGWAYQAFVRVVVDLGKVKPVGSVVARFRTLSASHTVPRRIDLAVSADGDYFHPVGNLSESVHEEDNPALTFKALPAETQTVYAVVMKAGYRARHVRLDMAAHGHVICDEIAVLAGKGEISEVPARVRQDREYRDNVFDRRDQYAKMIASGNLVAGQPLAYVPQPNYRLTTDDDDVLQLTDGELGTRTDERIWFEKEAVCWQGAPLVTILADLGEVQPVGAVVIRLLGGGEQGGLRFPDELRVLLSNDGDEYYLVGARHKRGLDDLSEEAWDLPEERIAWVHNFNIPVGQKARYVAVQIQHQKQFICSDELAIVKGGADLPDFLPSADKCVRIVSSGIAFFSHHARHPLATQPMRTKIAIMDARPGKAFRGPAKLVLDLPETVRFLTEGYQPEPVEHEGQKYQRYRIACNRGKLQDFYLQSLSPAGARGTLYMYGDAGAGLENERRIEWEAIQLPVARRPQRLHVSLAWSYAEYLYNTWPDYLKAFGDLGFNCVACFPRYWKEADVAAKQEILAAAREAGFKIIVNESPAGALSRDRKQEETKSQLPDGPSGHVCPSYRGQYYQKEHASFGQHAVWCRPDYIFYDIEAYWNGAREAPRCQRCKQRFAAGDYESWDEFYAAMGREIHADMKAATEEAVAEAGIEQEIVYGSYRTQPITKLNDGLFSWGNLYPDLLQIAMPSLYVAGNQMAVANNISQNRALMATNDIIPWLSTGTYGQYEPVRTRDMILEAFANGARGITYYWYGDFDPLHFKYHAEAIDMVARIEDIFVDGKPLPDVSCDNDRIKVCGMAAGDEMAVLVSNYQGVAATEKIKVTVPVKTRCQVYDLHSGKIVGGVAPGKPFEFTIGDIAAHMFYVGSKYADEVGR